MASTRDFTCMGGDVTGSTPNTPNLLSYDVLEDDWHSHGPPNRPILSVSYGGGVAISELGQGYVLGGWLSNNSVQGWSGGPLATNSLIKYDMNTNDWTNNTGPADSIPRAEGVMAHVPASDDGLLVYFGGVTAPYNNDTTLPAPMSLIHIYDIRSSKWYTQTAIGDTPLPRRKFCAGAVWAPDQSSYNIYLYGGRGFGANETGFDDVYILSIPSFRWIRWWESSDGGKPHHSLSCSVVGGGQMLIIGGTFPLNDECDSPVTWGTHNLDLGKRSGKMWNDYSANITSYVVPPEVISVVGGSSLGGATVTAPPAGFDNGDLVVYFAQKASVAVRSPTREIPNATSSPSEGSATRLSTGAIIGIAVGGAILFIALLFTGYCIVLRHRKKNADPPTGTAEVAYNPAPSSQSQFTPHTPQTPYFDQQQHTQTQHYQLAANSPPVELSDNDLPLHQSGPKLNMIHQVQSSPYSPPPAHHASPSPSSHPSFSAGNNSLHTNNSRSLYEEQTLPTPTYSSLSRGPREPLPPNQTFYSP